MIAAQAAAALLLDLFLAHALADQTEVAADVFDGPADQIDPSAGRAVGELGRRDLHVHGDGVLIAQEAVDIIGGYLTGRHGADDSGGTGDRVAAGEHVAAARHKAGLLRLNAPRLVSMPLVSKYWEPMACPMATTM